MLIQVLRFFTLFVLLFQNKIFANDNAFIDLRKEQRRITAHTVKSAVAEFDEKKSIPKNKTNGDEKRYKDLRGSFGKTLAHFPTGFINQQAFLTLLRPLQSGNPQEFDQIELGFGILKLVNPQSSFAFSLIANDSWINGIAPAPAFASAESAGEMVELYWTCLVRDVPFNQFSINPTALMAIAELSTLTDFKGPKINGQVTPQTFLRGSSPGDLIGPYISQFFYKTIPWGASFIFPELQVPLPGIFNDFMTNFNDWFTVINGGSTGQTIAYDPTLHFIRTPRDLGEYVHRDTPGQAALGAALYLIDLGDAALDPSNPYRNNPTQNGFTTFGLPYVLNLMRSATEDGLKAAWYQKWQIHRRVRPEEFGFYLQQQVANGENLGINSQLTQSQAIQNIFATFGSYFLPQAYAEGCPPHPSYPAGHASFAGAAITILKAFFNEDFILPNPIEPDPTNTALVPYPGILTIGGELNKLAFNIALGRDMAGVHYRSDGYDGILLGEKVAIDILENEAYLFNEDFSGYTLTKFDGTTIRVGGKKSI